MTCWHDMAYGLEYIRMEILKNSFVPLMLFHVSYRRINLLLLKKGLIQRVKALNYFLQDVYGEKKIIKDGMVDDNSRNSCVIGTY